MRRSRSTKLLNMKLTHQRMTNRYNNTPESILDWLEEQLENRGIDAVVYTRYILSLLQEDDSEFDEDNGNSAITAVTTDGSTGIGSSIGFKFCCEHQLIRKQTHNNSCVKENIKPVTTTKWKHKRYLKANPSHNNNCGTIVGSGVHSCHCCGNDYCSAFSNANTDEERKLAVVECLKSASEQEFGIESFVDELCAKLKNIKLLSETNISSPETNDVSLDCKSNSSNNTKTVSPKEQAMKYYAAFPALDSGVNEEKSTSKPNSGILAKKVAVDRKLNQNKWNGQKIIEFMTNSISNNGLLHGMTDETSSQQTLTTANICPKNPIPKLKALNIEKELAEETIESKFVNNNEEMIDKNNTKELINSLLQCNENKKFVYCGDIEKNVLNNDSTLVYNKFRNNNYNYNECNIEEIDKFQKLVDKFNSNIASIWSKAGDSNSYSALSKNENIWSFDSSFSSNQSSATPSPKLIDFWSSIAKTDSADEITNTTPIVEQMISNMTPIPEISWESSVLQSISSNDYNHNRVEEKSENWILSDFSLNEKINKSCGENSNTITLRNHQENSPFIEFNSLITSTPKQTEGIGECLQLSTLHPTFTGSTLKPNNFSPPEENLLTSPKTHFQPIKQESFDRDSSDDGSVSDLTDHEVNKLVICSAKCPNNVDNKGYESDAALSVRSVSTSFDELASFMGPFSDLDSNVTELSNLSVIEEIQFVDKAKDNKMGDKSTSTQTEAEIELKPRLEPIMETNVENEPEYQDLCNMINEVLRNGLTDDDSNCTSNLKSMVSMDDWYDDDIGDNCKDFMASCNREKRLSWNCYWDTYDTISDSVLTHQNELFAIENECKKILNEEISSDETIRSRYALNDGMMDKISNDCVLTESYDEVFVEELFAHNSNHVNDSVDDCHQNFYEEFNDFETNPVVDDGNDVENSDDYFWAPNDITDELSSDFGQPFNLQMKPRFFDVYKRNRKPCTFFIEGNCKRSDCKYSHDLSNITCKYWEEGFCFKAHLCPFLHGYVTDPNFESDNSSVLSSKKSYTIESESDFPSLATLPNSEDNTTIQEELEILNGVEHHFLDFSTKSVTDTTTSATNRKLPIVVFMKKKVKKRKDRNLQ